MTGSALASVMKRAGALLEARVGLLPAFPFGAAAVYAAAMALPALAIPGVGTYSGLDVLFEGWQGVRAGVFAWFANPLFIGAVLLALGDYRRTAGSLSGIGLVLALTSFAAVDLAAQNGVALPELGYLTGFYVWLGAQLVLVVWCWAGVVGREP